VKGRVVWVVDGDTIHVRIGKRVEKVRYIGVNAPEVPHEVRYWQGGQRASAVNRALVAKHAVRLELDVLHRDSRGSIECTKCGCLWVMYLLPVVESLQRRYVTHDGQPTTGWTREVLGG